MQPSRKRWTTLAVLAAWAFPAAVGLVGLAHLTLDPHHHDAEPAAVVALALAHGHSHPLEAPEHGHEAGSASVARAAPSAGGTAVRRAGGELLLVAALRLPESGTPAPGRPPPQVLTSVLLL